MKRTLSPPWFLLAPLLVLAVSVAIAQSATDAPLEQQMTPDEFHAAGLHKLTPDERAALQAWIQRQRTGAPATGTAPLQASAAVPAAAAALSADEIERIREQGREEGRQEVKEKSRGFFDFGSDEPIRSTLVGEFKGFANGKKYTLANGQVWEQIEPATLAGVRKTDPEVTIKPGMFNVWYLRINGYGTAAKVRRIK